MHKCTPPEGLVCRAEYPDSSACALHGGTHTCYHPTVIQARRVGAHRGTLAVARWHIEQADLWTRRGEREQALFHRKSAEDVLGLANEMLADASEWLAGCTAPREHGKEIRIRISSTAVRAYWDEELQTFVLSTPIHIESVQRPNTWQSLDAAKSKTGRE